MPSLLPARLAVSLYFVLHGFVAATWISRIPAISEGLALSPVVLGTVLVGNMVGALIGALLAGVVVGRWGSRRVTRLTAVAGALWLAALPLMPGAAWLFCALLIQGFLTNTLNIAMNAQATALEARYGRPIVSSFHALWSLGALVGALSGAGLADLGLKPWLHFFLIGLAFAGLAWAAGRGLMQIPPQPARRVFALPSRPILFVGVMGFCTAISDGSIAGWSGVYLRGLGASEAVAALGFAVHQGVMLAGRLAGDWLSGRFGPVRVARYGAWLAGGGLAVGVLLGSVPGAFIGIASMGLGMASLYPLMFAAAARLMPQNPAAGIASVSGMSTVGGIAGPPLLGQVAGLGGVGAAFLLAALLAGAVGWLAVSLAPRPAAQARAKGAEAD